MRGKLSYKLPLSLAAAAVVVGAVLSPVAGAQRGASVPVADTGSAPAASINSGLVATWTGVAGSGKFSVAGNWKENKVPVTGAKLVLPCAENELTLTNDLSGVKFAGIEAAPADGGKSCKNISIDAIDFADSIVFNRSGYGLASNLTLKKVTGATERVQLGAKSSGNLFFDYNTAKLTTNHLVVANGSLSGASFVTPKKSVEIENVGSYELTYLERLDKNITKVFGGLSLAGASYDGDFTLKKGGSISARPATTYDQEKKEWTVTKKENELTGKITLLGDATYEVAELASLKLSGSIEGEGFKLSPGKNSWGDFENATKKDNSNTAKGKQEFKPEKLDLKKLCAVKHQVMDSDERFAFFTIGRRQSATLTEDADCDKAYGTVVIEGRLGGVGTVKTLTVNGILAPGNSPGTITVKERLRFSTSRSVLEIEILNKDAYDKLVVGKDFKPEYEGDTSVAVEIVTGTTLNVTYLPDGKLKKGDVLTIIDNQSKTDVKGEFKDLPEGAEVRVGNATFTISYKGGDGNDVTLTAQNDSVAPKAPNTGAASLVANPAAAVAAGAAAVIALFVASKRRATGKR
ncbi:MAG: hypothetical protein Q4A34_00865 [Candidatus Saccharibacteria bacterium]|nr:hypothetical protein [Candidatus Saccharibacteria bacterium]